ncbi:PE-PPE domain-containing protein [Mycobacterium sp. MMS18-G62]
MSESFAAQADPQAIVEKPTFRQGPGPGRMTGTAKHIGRVGALAVALGVGNVRRAATRMTVSIGVAALVVMATTGPVPDSTGSPAVRLSADSTALIVCGTTCPTPDEYVVGSVMNQFITPTHPGQTITPVAVTTPEEYWPITGFLRLIGPVVGDPRLFGPGGPAWPDEPWWKLSGLFDLTIDQSLRAGVADLETAMTKYGNDHQVIFGDSQGAALVIMEKRKLAEQYPAGTTAPDIEFVLAGDTNLPNGGLNARFPGLYIPVLDLSFNGPEPTDTQFKTVTINRQYDGAADFPLYPLNVIADLNAVLGFLYRHTHPFDVTLAPDASTSAAYQGTHGDTSYYFFETRDLPLFDPLRALGVPEPLIDVVEPFFRVLVELGYDRTIPPWEPTPARLIPQFDPAKVVTDLVNAIGEGINKSLGLIGLPPLPSMPTPVTLAAPASETATADISHQVTAKDTPTQTEQAKSTGTAIGTRQMSLDTATSTTTVTETDPPTSAQTATDTEQPTPLGVTETTKAASTTASAVQPSTAARPEPSASASTPTPEKPRPVLRDSLGVDQQLPDRSDRGEADQPTTRTAAAGAEAATGEPSSTASSSAASSSAGSSSDGGSSGGDGDGS